MHFYFYYVFCIVSAIGLSDVENRFPMTTDHVIRIASISKVLTVTALAKLWERKKLDIDKPVQEFVPSFPEKTWENKKVRHKDMFHRIIQILYGILNSRAQGCKAKYLYWIHSSKV